MESIDTIAEQLGRSPRAVAAKAFKADQGDHFAGLKRLYSGYPEVAKPPATGEEQMR